MLLIVMELFVQSYKKSYLFFNEYHQLPIFSSSRWWLIWSFFFLFWFCLMFVWGFLNVYFAWTWQIKVSNSALISAFMTELEADTPVIQVYMWSLYWKFCMIFMNSRVLILSVWLLQCDYDRLQLSTSPFQERNMEFLIECMDDLSMEQQKVCALFTWMWSC